VNTFYDQPRHPTKVCYRNMSGESTFTKFSEVEACKKRWRGCQSGIVDFRSRRTFRERMYGAYVRSCRSPLRWSSRGVLAITLGGWVFIPRWLRHHAGDLQNASVPIELIIRPVVFSQMRLNDRFKDDT
jgi:hypothetical protein